MAFMKFVVQAFINQALAASAGGASSPGLMDAFTQPEDISEHGHLIDWLFMYTTSMNLFFFALVCIGLFGFCYLYSAKRHPKAYYTYGNKKAHIFVATAIGLSVFLAIDMNITRMSNDDYTGVFINWPKAEDDSGETFRVQVMAQQWAWSFRYAGKDGKFNTADDPVFLNELHLPANKKIVVQMISKDVIHSLYLPNARRKVDAIPGRVTRIWFQLNKPGKYDIACAEMCGTYHYRMQAKMKVHGEESFETWMEEAERKAIQENDPSDTDRFWGWAWEPAAEKDESKEVTMR